MIKLAKEGHDITPDIGFFTLAMAVFFVSWFRDGRRETSR